MARADDRPPTGANVLLVDDYPANLLALHAILEDLGPNLVDAQSGEEALRRLREDDFAAVLLDVQMHGLDGFETARLIRAQERSRHTPIIFLTAHEDNRLTPEEAYALGAVDYLIKPLVPVVLRAKVAGFIDLFQKTEQVRRQAERLRELERREFERQRARDSARYSAILASIGDGVITVDPSGRVSFLNPVAAALTGWAPQEADGQALEDVFRVLDGAARQMVDVPVARVVREDAAVGLGDHAVLVARDGSERPIEGCAFPVRDNGGDVTGVVLIARDVTERKRAEDALRASEARLARAQQIAHLGSWEIDWATREVYWSDEMYRLLGLTQGTVVPTIERFFEAVPGEDHDCINQALERAVHERVPYAVDHRVARPDGSVRVVSELAEFSFDEAGRPLRLTGTMLDVTERKQAEEALREADRRKDEFLATLAHELRNPLAPIRNSLHILRLSGGSGPAAERVHEMMERQMAHLVRLVDDLMEISRITRGKIELRKERVELAAILRSAVETARPLIAAARHQLAISLPPEPLTLEADPVRLAQVVANLLNNAAKYTEEGGQVWLSARVEGDEAVVAVRDNGAGIPADMLPRVFDLFTQVDRTLNRAQGGLGIGLSLVRHLVQMHGGGVEAKSAGLGQGSEFVVRLPLPAGHRRTSRTAHDQRPADTVLAPTRILVVDDNRDAADSLAMLLRFLGNDVQTVYDGPSALEAIAAYRPAVVLLDIGMPDMDGYEVARRVRAQPEFRDVALIAMTGWGQEEDRRRSREAGIDHHLVKPVAPDALQALLASLTAPCPESKRQTAER